MSHNRSTSQVPKRAGLMASKSQDTIRQPRKDRIRNRSGSRSQLQGSEAEDPTDKSFRDIVRSNIAESSASRNIINDAATKRLKSELSYRQPSSMASPAAGRGVGSARKERRAPKIRVSCSFPVRCRSLNHHECAQVSRSTTSAEEKSRIGRGSGKVEPRIRAASQQDDTDKMLAQIARAQARFERHGAEFARLDAEMSRVGGKPAPPLMFGQGSMLAGDENFADVQDGRGLPRLGGTVNRIAKPLEGARYQRKAEVTADGRMLTMQF